MTGLRLEHQHALADEIALGSRMRQSGDWVEDAQTLDLLRDYGVDFAQGFYIGRPAPIERS